MKKLLPPLFCALIIVGTYIRVPLPPVPITLQSMIIMIAAFTLDWKQSLTAVFLWLFLGLVGLPVFTSGGGIAAFLGPTGGYIWGMMLTPPLFSALPKAFKDKFWKLILLGIPLNLIIYLIGTAYLMHNRSLSAMQALSAGVIPFLIGDAVKLLVSAIVSPVITKQLEGLEKEETNC